MVYIEKNHGKYFLGLKVTSQIKNKATEKISTDMQLTFCGHRFPFKDRYFLCFMLLTFVSGS